MFDIALGIFLFLSPIFFLPAPIGNVNALQFYQFGVLGNGGYNYLQLLFFCSAIIGLFIVALLLKPQREFDNKWIVVLLSMFCLNVYFHPIGIKMIAPILLGFLLLYLVIVYTKDYKKLFKFIFLASLVNTIFAILQFFHINLIYGVTGRVDGLMCLSTQLGTYQALVLPICYSINPFLVIVPIIGIILSKSLIGIIVMFGWIIYKLIKIIHQKKIVSVPLVLAIIFSVIIFLSHNWRLFMGKFISRFPVWDYTIKEIINHPFLGSGIKPLKFPTEVFLWEHHYNIYLTAVHYLGVLVLVPIFMIFRKLIMSKESVLLLSCLMILVLGMEKPIFDYPRLAGTVIVLFGLLTVIKEKEGVPLK